MQLLLHTCCAPCAIHTVTEAKKDGFDITGFFYNPNIHPRLEYTKREKEAKAYFRSEGMELVSPEYAPGVFFTNVNEDDAERCRSCWQMRLEKTASFAKEKGFNAFTTTLLISPYQDHGFIKELAGRISKKTDVIFYYRDFRKRFRDSHRIARAKGMYCQNYCGCVFSMIEREKAKKE